MTLTEASTTLVFYQTLVTGMIALLLVPFFLGHPRPSSIPRAVQRDRPPLGHRPVLVDAGLPLCPGGGRGAVFPIPR